MNPKFAAIKHSADLKSVHGISVFYSEKVFFNSIGPLRNVNWC